MGKKKSGKGKKNDVDLAVVGTIDGVVSTKATKKAEKKADKAAKSDKKAAKAEKTVKSEKVGKAEEKAAKATDVPRIAAEVARETSSARSESAIDPAAFVEALRVGDGFRLEDVDSSSTPGFEGDKDDAARVMAASASELSDLQERLYAAARDGRGESVLLVVQGLDTAGKGGIMRHVVGLFDPQGVQITAFKQPTPEERRHPFLWRIRKGLPRPGMVGVFDRSHYEDVLVARVDDLVPASTWRRRFGQIRTFENSVTGSGTTIVKVMLHIGEDEQKARLAERLERPDKHWKYNPGDIDTRLKWDAYQEAYAEALTKTSTDTAPWYVVPADRKWYARLAVQQLLLDALRRIDPQWPAADFDVEAEKARLAAS